MEDRNTRARIRIAAAALALGAVLVSVPAFAQEVWQTYPMTVSSPAFGPGPAQSFAAAPMPEQHVWRARRARRPLYNSAARADLPQAGHACEVWQTYPMTVSTPANYVPTNCQ